MDDVTPPNCVHVVDDDQAVRDSLTVLLETEGMSVRAHASADRLLESIDADRTACVIADIRMPGIDGLQLQTMLADAAPTVPVILITGHGNIPMAVRAMKTGAADFIEKPFDPEDLLGRVRDLVNRHRHTPCAGAPIDAAEAAHRLARLTKREREVFDLLIRGYPNKEVARELGISPRTVEVHRRRVMEKMQARHLPHLVRMGIALENRNA